MKGLPPYSWTLLRMLIPSGETLFATELISEYIKHTGDTDTFIEFEDNTIKLKAANKNFLQY